MSKNRKPWLALILAFSILVSACSSGTTTTPTVPAPTTTAPAKPKILTVGYWSAPDSFNSITNKTSYGTVIISLIYPRLMHMDDKLTFQPSLAAAQPTVNATQDSFTFKIRNNAKWSDGKPITAHDVAYTYQVIAHPTTPTSRRSLIDSLAGLDNAGISLTKDFNVTGIKVVDDQTITFTTKAPVDVDAFYEKVASGIYIMPKHVLEPAVKANLKELDKADHVMKPTVFGGPFRFVEYKTDSHIELAPNPDFFLGAPKLDKLFVKIVGAASFAAALEKGEIDVAAGVGIGEVPVADWDKVSTLSTLRPVTYVAPSYQYLDINVAKPEFSKAEVRQAFAHAINRPLIVSRLLKGQGEVINTPLNSSNKYFVPALQTQLQYDAAKAKQMLTAAGWDFNKEVVILTPTGNVVREQSGDIIMANLLDIGVKAKIEKVDFPTRQARSAAGDWQISLVGFSATFDPDFSSQVTTGSAFNDRKYSNAAMDDVMNRGKQAVKFDDKKKVYDEAQALFVKELPLLPLYSVKGLAVVNNRVVAAQPGPHGLTWNAHLWDIK